MSSLLQRNTATIQSLINKINTLPEGEDVTEETNVYTTKIASLEAAVTALEIELEGKAGGGGLSGEISTCTIEIINETFGTPTESYIKSLWYVAYENGEFKGYGGYEGLFDDNMNKMPPNFDWYAQTNILNNVVCNSMMYIEDENGMLMLPQNWAVNDAINFSYIIIPNIPNVTHTLKLELPF